MTKSIVIVASLRRATRFSPGHFLGKRIHGQSFVVGADGVIVEGDWTITPPITWEGGDVFHTEFGAFLVENWAAEASRWTVPEYLVHGSCAPGGAA